MGVSRPEIGLYYRARALEKHGMITAVYADYASRDATLLRLGFSSYEAYLQSDLWKRIRSSAYMVHGRVCMMCGDGAEVVHHINYTEAVLAGKGDLDQLVPLCNKCHTDVEMKGGVKRSFRSASKKFKQLMGKRKKVRTRLNHKCRCGKACSTKRCSDCKALRKAAYVARMASLPSHP